jgi:hypothetical protein
METVAIPSLPAILLCFSQLACKRRSHGGVNTCRRILPRLIPHPHVDPLSWGRGRLHDGHGVQEIKWPPRLFLAIRGPQFLALKVGWGDSLGIGMAVWYGASIQVRQWTVLDAILPPFTWQSARLYQGKWVDGGK